MALFNIASVKRAARAALAFRQRLRFRLWSVRLRFQLRRFGAKLELEAPYGAEFDGPPSIKVFPDGDATATTTIRLGRGVRLGHDTTIEIHARGENVLEAEDGARLLRGVRIALRSGTLKIGNDALIRDGVWLKTDGVLSIGRGVTVGPGSALHCTEAITLEEVVGLGERVSIIDSDHTFNGDDVHYMRKPISATPVLVDRNSMVAVGSVLLRGARIGKNSVVAANSVVRGGDYPAGSVLGGNPATVIKRLSVSPIERNSDASAIPGH